MRGHLTILLPILLGALAVACGARNTGGLSVDDGRSVLAAAPAMAREAGTAHLTMTIDFDGPGVPADAGFEATGQIDFAAKLLSMEGTTSGVPEEMAPLAMIVTPDAMYMQMFPLRQQFGVDWLRMGYDDLAEESGLDVGEMMANQAMDPTAMLDQLAGVTDDIEIVGEEDVRGVPTTHYRATIDSQRAVEAAPESSREALRGLLEEGAVDDVYEIDVWIDADGLMRRQVMEVTAMNIAQVLTVETFDYGAPVNIVVPTDSIIEFPDWLARIRQMNPDTNQIPG